MTAEVPDDGVTCPCRQAAAAADAGDPAAFEAAVRWLARSADAGDADRRAFEAWLAESDCHRCAWARARYLWRLLGVALADRDLDGPDA